MPDHESPVDDDRVAAGDDAPPAPDEAPPSFLDLFRIFADRGLLLPVAVVAVMLVMLGFVGGRLTAEDDAEPGGEWSDASGRWGIQGGQAAAADGGTGDRIATIGGGSTDRLTEVTVSTVADGAGIVFRYRDPDNLWSMTASPDDGAWIVSKVVAGEATVAAEVPSTMANGTTIGVAQRGSELQILVEGQEALRVTDPALEAEVLSGIIVSGVGAGSARFDRFLVGDVPVT